MSQIFTQRALQKRRRVGDRTGPVTLLTPPLRATLLLGGLIALGGGLWATLARIPVNVQGTGVLLPVSTINSSLSGTDGSAIYMFNRSQQVWQEKARAFLQTPMQFNDREMAQLAVDVYEASQPGLHPATASEKHTASSRFSDSLKEAFNGLKISEGRLLLWIQSSAELEQLSSSIDQLNRTLRKSSEETINIEAKQEILKSEHISRSAYLESMRPLEAKGFVSRSQILEQQARIDSISSQIRGNDNELIRISSQKDHAYQKVRTQLAQLINNQLIYAPRDVYLSTIIPNDGESVSRGDVLMELSENRLDEPTIIPVFLTSSEMAQVFPGMPALATPSGYKRSEVGGIKGTVISMGKLPSDVDQITARIGVKAMAQTIASREPSPTLAIVALERSTQSPPMNSGGYVWSSNSDLPFPPTPGDQVMVEITTRRVAPIALVLPAIKNFFGLTPPNKTAAGSSSASHRR